MADLEQIEENNKLVMGWYGSCDSEPCSDFPLKTQDVYDVIESVYEISTDTSKPRIFSSYLASENDSFVQSLESLECGHTYWFTLKQGVVGDLKSLTIDNLVTTGEQIADAGRVTDDCDSGGGGGVANIMFLTDSPSDNGDLRISIGADLTEINSLCTSNVWAYRIEKLANQTDETGTQVQGITFAPGDQNSVTVLSSYISSTDGGASWYKVYIQGYAADQTTAVTDEISEKVFIDWPVPMLVINGELCTQTRWIWPWNQVDDIVNEIPHTNTYGNDPLITACQIKNVSYLEYEGPSNVATFDLSKYLISDMTMAPIRGAHLHINTQNGIPADQNLWEYSIDGGAYSPFVPETTITDASKLQVRLSAKDENGDDWSPGNYSVDVIFGYKGMGDSPITYVSYVQVNAEIKDRSIQIANAVDNDALGINLSLYRTNVTQWSYRLIGPSGTNLPSANAISSGSYLMTYVVHYEGPGDYQIVVWGVSQINGVWVTVTPESTTTVPMNWPPPILNLSDNINEGYEEESGPSAGNNILTITHNWVTEYKISMPDNTAGAWEIKRNGESDSQYVTLSTTPTSYLSRPEQIIVGSQMDTANIANLANTSDKYILRLKDGLSADSYNRNFILNGTAKDGSTISQKSTQVNGNVSVKPPCCTGFSDTFITTGPPPHNMIPEVSAGGLSIRTEGFDSNGAFCFNSGSPASLADSYTVTLHTETGEKLNGQDLHGLVMVQGTWSSPSDANVVYSFDNKCYRGSLLNKAADGGNNILTADPARDMTTVFGVD